MKTAAWFSTSSRVPCTPGYLMGLQVFPINADAGLSLKCIYVYVRARVCYFFPKLVSLSEQ